MWRICFLSNLTQRKFSCFWFSNFSDLSRRQILSVNKEIVFLFHYFTLLLVFTYIGYPLQWFLYSLSMVFFVIVLSLIYFYSLRNNKDNLSIWCLLLPQILFLSCIFLYLVILIFFKWVAYTAETASSAPSLLIGKFSNFFG